MAIQCNDPNKIGTQAEELFSYIVGSEGGKGLMDKFETSINNFKSHWIGSDAKANITDLITVYDGVKALLSSVENYIVSVNNMQILPMQRNIVNDGGQCTIGNELSFISVGSSLTVPQDTIEYRVAPEMIADAADFEDVPAKFTTFVDTINNLKETLLGNWLDGVGREEVVNSFKTFNEDVAEYNALLNKVKSNIDTVAANKKNLM